MKNEIRELSHSKCGCPQGHVGSNPTFSAKTRLTGTYIACEFCHLLARLISILLKRRRNGLPTVFISQTTSRRGVLLFFLLRIFLRSLSGYQTNSTITNISLFFLTTGRPFKPQA